MINPARHGTGQTIGGQHPDPGKLSQITNRVNTRRQREDDIAVQR